ncbi:DUF4153 domain-containing protein [Lutispora sp.]|uniref:DUF4153 domain-containing protein n=1 Tax=Lutispora sp. TaxID=2828727 RepID=UPI002B1FEA30|nr:DUF4173 domain-containing protein [Lutispora sp.]MEA4961794.1 DUF4173 domain-containing protein [Lutispora sp.]
MKGNFSSDKVVLSDDAAQPLKGEEALRGYKSAEPFIPDNRDVIFAFLAFVLGFFFARWVLFSWQGWGVTAFTIGYCLAVTMYLMKKGVSLSRSGFFWLAAITLTGMSYSLYPNNGLEPWRSLFLFCAAIYYVLHASGRLILCNTGNWLLLDGINGLFVIPFKNFACQYKSLSSPKYIKGRLGRQILSIMLGLLLALLVAGMVLPLLMRADSGGFSKIANTIYEYYRWMKNQFMDFIFNGFLAIPIAAYLFGLVSGCAHNRGCNTFKREGIQYAIESAKVLSLATVYTALGLICGLYLLFIGSQLPYFFSAFAGQRPEGWQIYSEYARSGFFELCQIAAINLSILVLANIFCKKPQQRGCALKIFNCLLSLLTMILIATAFSKMALYIGAYGLSIRRLLPCLFMGFLSFIFAGVIALQKWQFSIVRLSLFIGTLMLCSLCLLNPDGFVARYNADRFLSGTLESFDVEILYLSGPSGIDPALKIYAQTGDDKLRAELRAYIYHQRRESEKLLGKSRDSLQDLHVRQKVREFAKLIE